MNHLKSILMYKRIIKECFWDYNISQEEIIKIAKSQNNYMKKFIFGKILGNSTNILKDLKIVFNQEDIKILLKEYKVSNFKYKLINKRKKIVEYIFFNKKIYIEGLEWQK